MKRICVLVEHDAVRLDACSAMVVQHAVRLALEQQARVTAVAFFAEGEDPGQVREALEAAGVGEFVAVRYRGAGIEPCVLPRLIEALDLQRVALLLAPATAQSSMLAARAAATLKCAVVSDCVALAPAAAGACTFKVATAGGMAWVDCSVEGGAPVVVLMPLRDIDAAAAPAPADALAVTQLELDVEPDVKLVESVKVRREDMTLAEAPVIVSGGRGLGGPEGFAPLGELARLIGAHVGASRVATDMGWIDRKHLVGMSGSTVRPSMYLAAGISGAPHHLMGMRDSTMIVALNSDENAPIMKMAHHAFVGDANEVLPRVVALLSQANGGVER